MEEKILPFTIRVWTYCTLQGRGKDFFGLLLLLLASLPLPLKGCQPPYIGAPAFPGLASAQKMPHEKIPPFKVRVGYRTHPLGSGQDFFEPMRFVSEGGAHACLRFLTGRVWYLSVLAAPNP